MKKRNKPYWEMNADELAEATAEFDQSMVIDKFRPPTPAERAEWERFRRKLGRPRRGRGAKVVSVSIERGLLERSDALARKLGIPRAALIEKGLRAALIIDGGE
ncbi:MAG: ribbon-helix-helix domain-containing protein [Phycisphaerae bacterium]|nr:ribbon-helix-helix domain-containing protein [Phycisphaerae bacterium]